LGSAPGEDTVLGMFKDRFKDFLDKSLDPELKDRIKRLDARLNEYGVDPFGFEPDYVKYILPFVLLLHKHWFRVQTHGMKNLPKGRVLLIANHSGQVPLDAMMIVLSVFLESEPPRIVRSMIDTWVPTLPVVSWFFARAGQIVGTRENCRILLDRDEAILAFPEGMRGINKTFDKRYQLEEFGLGFMRLALMTNAPIVPVAVIGAEEQAPALFNLKSLGKLVGLPALPITPTGVVPLPSKYHIYFGKPMHYRGNPNDEDAVLEAKVKTVRQTVQRMLRDGLKARKHVFW
jgi:1-acyl-sn-glycerol-3-phosphate acyltransferase